MLANVGKMFYYGEIPWHKEGTELDFPANREEAIEFGGLDWEVETVGLKTDEEPPSKVDTRFAIVRKYKPKGHAERVVGVAHKDFRPLQNREGIRTLTPSLAGERGCIIPEVISETGPPAFLRSFSVPPPRSRERHLILQRHISNEINGCSRGYEDLKTVMKRGR